MLRPKPRDCLRPLLPIRTIHHTNEAWTSSIQSSSAFADEARVSCFLVVSLPSGHPSFISPSWLSFARTLTRPFVVDSPHRSAHPPCQLVPRLASSTLAIGRCSKQRAEQETNEILEGGSPGRPSNGSDGLVPSGYRGVVGGRERQPLPPHRAASRDRLAVSALRRYPGRSATPRRSSSETQSFPGPILCRMLYPILFPICSPLHGLLS